MSDHPYKHLEGRPEWKALDRAISNLVRNGDLVESTPRAYIVGYLLSRLDTLPKFKAHTANGHKDATNGYHVRPRSPRALRRRTGSAKKASLTEVS